MFRPLIIAKYSPPKTFHQVSTIILQWRRVHSYASNLKDHQRIKLRTRGELQKGFDLLLSTLRSPENEKHLKHLELDRPGPCLSSNWQPEWKMQPVQRSLCPEDLERLKLAIRNAGLDEGEEKQGEMVLNMLLQVPAKMPYIDSKLHFVAHALAALLVSISPQLESLALCPVFTFMYMDKLIFNKFIAQANTAAKNGTPPPYLQNLRHVRFLPDTDSIFYDEESYAKYQVHDCLTMVRKLPALESVRFDTVIPDDDNIRPPSRSANYSSISIYRSHLSPEDHRNIVLSARTLKQYTYTVGGRYDGGWITTVRPGPILEALLVHRDTLESLDLDIQGHTQAKKLFDPEFEWSSYDDGSDELEAIAQKQYEVHWADELREMAAEEAARKGDSEETEQPRPRCALRSFHKLKHLSIGGWVLYSYARGVKADWIHDEPFSLVDHLPPNLETLRIYGYKMDVMGESCPEDVDAQIEQLVKEKGKKLPFLKTIEGIDVSIPNGQSVLNLDSKELLWRREREDWWEDEEDDEDDNL